MRPFGYGEILWESKGYALIVQQVPVLTVLDFIW